MAIEHLAGLPQQLWPGLGEGLYHFVEVDFFELDLKDQVALGIENVYGGAMHDWYGAWNGTCRAFCRVTTPQFALVRRVPGKVDFTQYHRYGFLWVPATPDKQGFGEYYFDDRKIGLTATWSQYRGQRPPPVAPWIFSIMDSDHLALVLGTGVNEPMTVASVSVWQASGVQNIFEPGELPQH